MKSLVEQKEEDIEFEINPLVKSLWGSVKPMKSEADYQSILSEELAKKHLGSLF